MFNIITIDGDTGQQVVAQEPRQIPHTGTRTVTGTSYTYRYGAVRHRIDNGSYATDQSQGTSSYQASQKEGSGTIMIPAKSTVTIDLVSNGGSSDEAAGYLNISASPSAAMGISNGIALYDADDSFRAGLGDILGMNSVFRHLITLIYVDWLATGQWFTKTLSFQLRESVAILSHRLFEDG